MLLLNAFKAEAYLLREQEEEEEDERNQVKRCLRISKMKKNLSHRHYARSCVRLRS